MDFTFGSISDRGISIIQAHDGLNLYIPFYIKLEQKKLENWLMSIGKKHSKLENHHLVVEIPYIDPSKIYASFYHALE